MKVFLVEVGILLDETDKEFDAYSTVYDKKHGYFDENTIPKTVLNNAKEIRLNL